MIVDLEFPLKWLDQYLWNPAFCNLYARLATDGSEEGLVSETLQHKQIQLVGLVEQ